MERRFTLHRPDGQDLACYCWGDVAKPRAIVVVAHGMGEHARRYRPALARLMDSGIVLYALDHRGHGDTIAMSNSFAGDFGPGGFDAVVEDLAALVKLAVAEQPTLPVFLLGHSMGSFIGQAFLIEHSALVDGVVLVGTAPVDQLAVAMAGEADALIALNRPFQPARTSCDWLSSDEHQVDLYVDDPLCGFSLLPESMVALFSQGARLADPAELARIPKDLPMYILCGGRDALTMAFSKLETLVGRYRAVGLDPVVVIYPEGRHEILNEVNREEVVGHLLDWLNSVIERAPRGRSA